MTRVSPNPFDTLASAGLRFLVEIIAWSAGPWAVFALNGRWWMAALAGVVLIALPTLCSTPGDKVHIIVPTPGPIRAVIELALAVVAIAGSWLVWPLWVTGAVVAVVIAERVSGARRFAWLIGQTRLRA